MSRDATETLVSVMLFFSVYYLKGNASPNARERQKPSLAEALISRFASSIKSNSAERAVGAMER